MHDKLTHSPPPLSGRAEALKSWTIVALTLLFTLFYGAALLGWIKPPTDERMAARLEPIIFVLLGYYFGRLPTQQHERILRDEINRQMQRADAAQHAKEQMQQAREALEEKLKNVRTVFALSALGAATKNVADNAASTGGAPKTDALRQSVAVALELLNS